MIFGHNSNLRLAGIVLHVQTEDRGEAHALLDTTVSYRGRGLHRRTHNYFDLLPLDEDRQQALKLRLEEQHRAVMEEIRSGLLDLAIPREPETELQAAPAISKATPSRPPAGPSPLRLELTNAKTWLSGKHANLRIFVQDPSGRPVGEASVRVEIDGAESEQVFEGCTSSLGHATIEFDLPRMNSAEAALVIKAQKQGASGNLRFALRVKPRVPSV